MEQQLLYIKEVDSTNSYLKSLVKSGIPLESFAVYTDYQSGGKGQRGKAWESEDAQNVLVSFMVTSIKDIKDLPKVNLAAVQAIAQTLSNVNIGN